VATDGLHLDLDLDLETKVYNTHQSFDPDGKAIFTYRKTHLFNLKSSDGVLEFRESDSFLPGAPPERLFDVTCGARVWKALTLICYDLRFPEIFRMQHFRTAPPEVVFLPSAFTHRTGKAHWEVLVRARAIENQCYIVACNQTGYFDGGLRRNYGHSIVVSPWGEVILDMGEPEGIGMVDLSHEDVFRCRDQLPALRNRVL
jgi:nitrilase